MRSRSKGVYTVRRFYTVGGLSLSVSTYLAGGIASREHISESLTRMRVSESPSANGTRRHRFIGFPFFATDISRQGHAQHILRGFQAVNCDIAVPDLA